MSRINLNNNISIDLEKLIDSKLLVQANSGGGKSWAIRRILEQSHGKVQQIVLDMEGEFSTLREKFEYVLVGEDGDLRTDLRSAALLPIKLLEENVSAIIDLYELKPQDRKRYVKLFLDAMINSPKRLHHPCIIVLDEAHVFAPEKSQAESLDAVITMASMGRKRDFCLIPATQRLSKLHKDVAAECNNKMIGRTGLDIDRKRASDELGFRTKEDSLSLRDLDPGEFYIFGNAFGVTGVEKVKVGSVQTTHERKDIRKLKGVTKPTEKIKKVLGKLDDLPQEAQKKLVTEKELRDEITSLRRHRCPKVEIDQKAVDVAVTRAVSARDREWKTKNMAVATFMGKVRSAITGLNSLKFPDSFEPPEPMKIIGEVVPLSPRTRQRTEKLTVPLRTVLIADEDGDEKVLTGGALRMVKVLTSRYPMKMSKVQLATFSKLKSSSGTYGTYMSILRAGRWFEQEGGLFFASERALDEYGGGDNTPQSPAEVIEMWKGVLKGGAKRMFSVLIDNYPNMLSKEELAGLAGLEPTSGTFGTYMSILRSNELIEEDDNPIKASDNLFLQ